MCGITLLLERDDAALHSLPSILDDDHLAQEIGKRLRQRGPDHFGRVDRSLSGAPSSKSPTSQWRLRLYSAVLHLRGDALTPQPLEDIDGNVLCWNGEVFGYRDVHGHAIDIEHGNDTQWLSELLVRESHMTTNEEEDDNHDHTTNGIIDTLRRIHGPFAFVWFHAATQRVFFGHDRFGRRSLLVHSDMSEQLTMLATSAPSPEGNRHPTIDITNLQRFVLSSVALSHASDKDTPIMDFVEVPANGMFVLDLRHQRLAFHAYNPLTLTLPTDAIMRVQDRYNCGLPQLAEEDVASPLELAAHGLLLALSNAVGVRVRTIPCGDHVARVGVLFSGGLDSVVLAALTHFHVDDPHEPIDLLNVCFDSGSHFQSPDRLAAMISYRELCTLYPTRPWRFVCVNEEYERVVVSQQELVTLLRPCDTHMDFNIGAAFWCLSRCHGSVYRGETHTGDSSTAAVDLNAFLTQQGVSNKQREGEAALQALALFGPEDKDAASCPANKCKRKRKPGCPFSVCRFCCLKIQKLLATLSPTNETGESGESNDQEQRASRLQLIAMLLPTENADAQVDELLRVWDTHWRFSESILCRVHRTTQPGHNDRDRALQDQTVLPPYTIEKTESYTTTARVLLVGIGADEQLGGYGRHKTAFVHGGSDALKRELALDMARIWKRNLGRDDRCISAHGREARFPFLDEAVVAYIASLPLTSVCDFAQPRGRGDKLVLRHTAQLLGLNNCSRLAKRAIQFGSRIAKHANVAAFGSNRQASGDAKIHAVDE